MRRFALVLVVLGGVLLAVTVVVATRPDRAPARGVRARHAVLAPRPAVLRVSPAPGARAVPTLPLLAPRAAFTRPRIERALTVPGGPVAPGGSCTVAAGGCSLHPCVIYAGAAPMTAVLRSSGILLVLPQVLARPRPAPTLIVPIPGPGRAAGHRCVSTVPGQRLVSARIASAG